MFSAECGIYQRLLCLILDNRAWRTRVLNYAHGIRVWYIIFSTRLRLVSNPCSRFWVSGEGLWQRLVGATWPSRYLCEKEQDICRPGARWKPGVRRSWLVASDCLPALSAHLVSWALSYRLTDKAHIPSSVFIMEAHMERHQEEPKQTAEKQQARRLMLFRKEWTEGMES